MHRKKAIVLRAATWLLLGVAIVAALYGCLVVGVHLHVRWKYPYGWSHCCDKSLMLSLRLYAAEHEGAYPAGESSPEASLSLLYPQYLSTGEELRGKTVPLEVVQPILERGDRLGPDSCGWHYVEGLRLDDDPRLALFWDKAGLGHNGERLPDGGHWVVFIGDDNRYIPESDWDAFLEEQAVLLEECRHKRAAAGE